MSVNERIQYIVDKMFSGNKAAFSKRIGIKPTTISNIIGRDRASKPSSEILENIVLYIPELNSDWLLTGHGEMLKPASENNSRNVHNTGNISGGVMTGDNNAPINTSISSDSEQRILLLEEKVQHLEEMLKEKERFIQVLLKK